MDSTWGLGGERRVFRIHGSKAGRGEQRRAGFLRESILLI
jgi:hypothetical protein